MTPGDNFYGRQQPMGKAFAGSLLTHGAIAGLIVLSGIIRLGNQWGSEHASSGSVGVGIVNSIPIPRNEGHINPLAADTKNLAPQQVEKAKPAPQAPEPDAVALRDRLDKRKPQPQRTAANQFRPMEYKANQVYTQSPQAANSPLFGKAGAGGIDIGAASVLGNRFGAYVDLMRQRIAQNWNTADVHSGPQQRCLVTFTIARNGTVSDVKVSQPSGNYLLDTSAKRAIIDANPLPSLPAQFDQPTASVELWFQIRQ
jgi:protein TonB